MGQVASNYEFIEQLEVLPQEELARRVLLEILMDVEKQDVEATFNLLSFLPNHLLKTFLPEED